MVEAMTPAEQQFWRDVADAVVTAAQAGLTDRDIAIALTGMLGRLLGAAYDDAAALESGIDQFAAALRAEAKARLAERS